MYKLLTVLAITIAFGLTTSMANAMDAAADKHEGDQNDTTVIENQGDHMDGDMEHHEGKE